MFFTGKTTTTTSGPTCQRSEAEFKLKATENTMLHERERETARQTDRQTDRDRDRERERD